MRVLIINVTCGTGSHGKICKDIADKYAAKGHDVKIAYGRGRDVPKSCKKYAVKIGTDLDVYLHVLYARITDRSGFASKRATRKFLRWAQHYNPNLVWLHNIHGYYINIEQLFQWIKSRPDMHVRWTLHDCWAFTGHCIHFTYAGCSKWKRGCKKCGQLREYPRSLFIDSSKKNYEDKKNLFCGIPNMNLIVPSKWLKDLVKKSYLKEYPVKVKYNYADSTVFRPGRSDFKEIYNLKEFTVILGVANVWNSRKGLSDFIKLSRMLDDSCVIVLVGLTKRQIACLPRKMIGIGKTSTQFQLADIYRGADIYVNMSREETFGLTTLEAIRCGTKTIVYDNSACREIASMFGGIIVQGGVKEMYREIVRLISETKQTGK